MEGTDGQTSAHAVPLKRKRAKRYSSCLMCRAAHRACSTERPCQRCIYLGEEEKCLQSAQEEKSKRRKLNGSRVTSNARTKTPLPHNPQHHDFVSQPSISPQAHHGFSVGNLMKTNISSSGPLNGLLGSLLSEIQHLNSTTSNLREQQEQLRKELETQQQQREWATPKPVAIQKPKVENLTLDEKLFKPTSFMPFAVKDASKPWAVIKPIIENHRVLDELFRVPVVYVSDAPCYVQSGLRIHMLMPSPSFCNLLQYRDEEILGDGASTSGMKYPDLQPPLQFLAWMYPQAPDMHVSPVVVSSCMFRKKNGQIIRAITKAQFFYEEGKVSFIISNIETYEFVDEVEIEHERELLRRTLPKYYGPLPSTLVGTEQRYERPLLRTPELPTWANALPPSPGFFSPPSPWNGSLSFC